MILHLHIFNFGQELLIMKDEIYICVDWCIMLWILKFKCINDNLGPRTLVQYSLKEKRKRKPKDK